MQAKYTKLRLQFCVFFCFKLFEKIAILKILLYNDFIPIEIGNFFGGDSNVKKTY